MFRKILGPLYPFAWIYALLLGFLSLARLTHTFIFYDHLDTPLQVFTILLSGLRVDLMMMAFLFSFPILVYLVLQVFVKPLARPFAAIIVFWTVAVSLAFIFLEFVTPSYLFEYGVRPERKFFEYLNHPREVFLMLANMYGILALVILMILAGITPFIFRFTRNVFRQPGDYSIVKFLVLSPLVLVLLIVSARSSLDHRPMNPSTIAFTDDALTNTLPLNSLYSVLYAAYRLKDEAVAAKIYGAMPREEVFERVEREFAKHNRDLSYAGFGLNSGNVRSNLVILLEESMGARFVEKLGGEALTPNLNKLAEEGWWFNHLYATGTRSVRGIEAVVTGFLPTPGRGVVKLSNAQSNFFTLASLLREYGYRSQFYYGGNAHFDNMKGFFLGNGFHQVVEQRDFVNPRYEGSWGASDGDVLRRIHQELLQDPAQPKLMVMLSTSNHTPFDFPVDASDNFSEPLKSRENSVRYADKALGEFFSTAKRSDYWQHTIFLVVADHDLRVSDFIVKPDPNHPDINISHFPVEGFHIPGLILGGGILPKQIDTVVSQIDLPPTLLGLAGIAAKTPMLGTDFTRVGEDYVGRAVMQFNDHQAYLSGTSLAVLRPGMPTMTGDYVNGAMTQKADANFDELSLTALAHALWSSITYRDGLYH